jgi:tetratricopeptide (TPR) repeat protein
LAEQKKWDEAIAAYQQGLERQPKDHDWAYRAIGRASLGKGDVDQAIAAFRKAIELNRDFEYAHGKLHEALMKKDWKLASGSFPQLIDPRRAFEASKQAVELAPSSTLFWQYQGWVQYRLSNWKASIEALEKSCKLQKGGKGDAGQWIVLALAHAKLAAQDGMPDKERDHHQAQARRWYEQADKQIDSWWSARPGWDMERAIWDFRAEARELMGVTKQKQQSEKKP